MQREAPARTIIRMRDIIKRFYIGTPNELQILNGISLDVREGEFLSIVGESGSGKSTLMNIIGALDRPTEGTYELDGVRVDEAKDDQLSKIRNGKIGFVFQTFNLIPRTSALKNVELPMLYAGVPAGKRTKRAKELLEMVEMTERMNHMPNELSGGQKQRVAVARALRKHAPQVAPLIGFYNAGLSRSERKRIEQLFRTDALLVLIATSAFGEGVDIPNIRHVVLYHMPFNEIEFNQMSGRAGRDGKPACVHLLFSRNDCALNERILADMTPCHDSLAQVYRKLRAMQRASDTLFFTTSDAELAKNVSTDIFPVNTASVTCAVAVFRELGLIEAHAMFGPDGLVRSIHVKDTQDKVQLTDSVRYREGMDEREIFHAFRDWVMRSNAADLQKRVSHPILPTTAVAKEAGNEQVE